MVLDQLIGHKATARRFLEEDRDGDRVAEYGELCTPDYVEHDPAMPRESVGLADARETYRGVAAAFGLRHSVEQLVAEGDLVCARFTVRGRHVGEYQGSAPTGRTFEVTGQVTLRFRDEKIAESWFNWDMQGMLEQLNGAFAASD
ncbi:ester cyclase [Actinomadura graeca]|uniref:Ester cyclase n=1 Tax=Actinomadura graeca TaxID=2750812 RepID=A0ABX8R1U5_9ACTN|nr:ester cyclase [Actinomadura graeca]QXJ24219.1 ester cyclase [Actinomadura graeca]